MTRRIDPSTGGRREVLLRPDRLRVRLLLFQPNGTERPNGDRPWRDAFWLFDGFRAAERGGQNDTSAACLTHSTDWCPVSVFHALRTASILARSAGVSGCRITSTFESSRSGAARPRNSHCP